MNFFADEFAVKPEWSTHLIFWVVVAAMVVLPASMYAWVKLRRWL
jgi:Mg2+ and Co2+ transporter CorA